MRLFHFSDDPGIRVFEPRPVLTPVDRPAGQSWLNGSLVWAIDEAHAFLYLFPRECPRILVWATPTSSQADIDLWIGRTERRAVAYVERDWLPRILTGSVHRYELPTVGFEHIGDVGMWVSRSLVRPLALEAITDLGGALEAVDVELRVCDSLLPLKPVWRTSLHASGIRLRNARGWNRPGWLHSKPGRPSGE